MDGYLDQTLSLSYNRLRRAYGLRSWRQSRAGRYISIRTRYRMRQYLLYRNSLRWCCVTRFFCKAASVGSSRLMSHSLPTPPLLTLCVCRTPRDIIAMAGMFPHTKSCKLYYWLIFKHLKLLQTIKWADTKYMYLCVTILRNVHVFTCYLCQSPIWQQWRFGVYMFS